MARQDTLNEIEGVLGGVPGWLEGIPDPQLEHQWGLLSWFLSDTELTAQQKALVAFGAAAAAHCHY